jgi:hypothetical protein
LRKRDETLFRKYKINSSNVPSRPRSNEISDISDEEEREIEKLDKFDNYEDYEDYYPYEKYENSYEKSDKVDLNKKTFIHELINNNKVINIPGALTKSLEKPSYPKNKKYLKLDLLNRKDHSDRITDYNYNYFNNITHTHPDKIAAGLLHDSECKSHRKDNATIITGNFSTSTQYTYPSVVSMNNTSPSQIKTKNNVFDEMKQLFKKNKKQKTRMMNAPNIPNKNDNKISTDNKININYLTNIDNNSNTNNTNNNNPIQKPLGPEINVLTGEIDNFKSKFIT